jgi:hypothetical protein
VPVNDIFGQFVSLADVEQAVIAQLQNWIPAYIAEVERQADLPPQTIPLPPDPVGSYRGGIDFDTWQAGLCPCLITVVAPLGEPEREFSDGTYLQMFEIQVAAILQMEDEDTTRRYAQYYGIAVANALLQHGSLGSFPNGNQVAVKSLLAAYPTLAFPNPDERRVIRTVVGVHSYIDGVLTEAAGPAVPPENPYAPPGGLPEVAAVAVTVTAEPLS